MYWTRESSDEQEFSVVGLSLQASELPKVETCEGNGGSLASDRLEARCDTTARAEEATTSGVDEEEERRDRSASEYRGSVFLANLHSSPIKGQQMVKSPVRTREQQRKTQKRRAEDGAASPRSKFDLPAPVWAVHGPRRAATDLQTRVRAQKPRSALIKRA